VLLPDGRVLVAGGFSEKRGTLDTAEIYDPRPTFGPDNWSHERPARTVSATPLRDGRVLLVGGLSLQKRGTLASAEIYDPRTNTFTPTAGPPANDRFGHAAALLPDGRVLIVGGKSWQIGQPDRALARCRTLRPPNRSLHESHGRSENAA
jgi:hypothetical protein